MLSIVASEKWGWGYGTLPKADGTAYATEKGAFRNHPCTVWANESIANARWLLTHGLALCEEYSNRYGKIHTCIHTLAHANKIFPLDPLHYSERTPFVFAGPDEFKHDNTVDIYTKYKMYISSKPWVSKNYLRIPDRKPEWV